MLKAYRFLVIGSKFVAFNGVFLSLRLLLSLVDAAMASRSEVLNPWRPEHQVFVDELFVKCCSSPHIGMACHVGVDPFGFGVLVEVVGCWGN